MTAAAPRQLMADKYVDFIANLTPTSVPQLREIALEDMYFRDPFNEVRDVEKVIRALQDMFEDIPNARFEILYRTWAGEVLILKWRYSGTAKYLGNWEFDGLSEVEFAADGRVASHVDHWDASVAFYLKLPIIGAILRFVRNRLRVD